MNLKYVAPLIPLQISLQYGGERSKALSWAPNNSKLAVARGDRVIQLFDDKGASRDKFATRPGDSKAGATSYMITSLCFSPDSTHIAIGQSDCCTFVYRIGDDFKMKKTITHKFTHTAAVTCVIWPNDMDLISGLSDGKMRYVNMVGKGQKAKTVYNVQDGYVLTMASNSTGTELLASFVDGQIVLFGIGNADQISMKLKVRHPVPAVALALGQDSILAGGSDLKITVYDKGSSGGRVKQQFDYSKEAVGGNDFNCAAATSGGQAVAFGSLNRIKLFQYQSRKKVWEEGKTKKIDHLYVPTALQWRKDGTYLAVSNNLGTFHLFEAAYKKSKSDKLELSYVTPSNVILKVVQTGKSINLKSKYGSEITDVQLMGRDCYAVARTMETIIICDLERGLTSEIPWSDVDDKERFYFENATVCMIFNGGEMTLVEYGKDEVLGTFRTEWANPHVISVRVNERVSKSDTENGIANKKLAYLLDLKSIVVVDLEYNLPLAEVIHDSKIDWLELNETGTKLLFRDRRSKLTLVDVGTLNKNTLDQSCGFVSWVPGSDVVVAQSKNLLRIWYNLDTSEVSVDMEVRGLATDIVKDKKGRTLVTVRDGTAIQEVELDNSRIEFTTAIEDGDLARAAGFLDSCEMGAEVRGMWAKLAKVAVDRKELRIAHKAYASVGDVPRAKFIQNTIELCKNEAGVNPNDKGWWKQSYQVEARLHLMEGRIKDAEALYLRNGDVDKAIEMYETLGKWDEAITLAKIKNHPRQKELTDGFLDRLISSGQYDVAAEFLEKHGHMDKSISLYLEGGFPTRAARILLKNRSMVQANPDLVSQVTDALLQGEFLEEAGELYESLGQRSRALDCYRRGFFYDKAIKLAKQSFQNQVVTLEEEWGDHLVNCRQLDAAANHYIEAGCLIKGLDAALEARQWKKALHIIEAIDDTPSVSKQWVRLGDHFNSIDELSQAEKCYMKGGAPKKAVEMYTEKDRWEDAHRIATQSTGISKQELQRQYIDQARKMEEQGRYGQAEKLFIAIGEVDMAIKMYATNKMYDEVLRLIQAHRAEHLPQTLKHLAEICLQEENYKAAENHYVRAGLWQEAVEMYVTRGLWEDAYRVARTSGGAQASKNVIFKWSAALSPDTAVKLLNKFGYIYDCIDHHCLSGNFHVAEEIAQLGARDKLLDIHFQWAQHCEEKREYEEARTHYVQANLAKEAVDMYLRARNLQKAIETAEKYAPEELQRVLLMHAESLFESKDFSNFEAILIRAEKPEIAVELYKRHGMWAEAFRVCKQYAPHLTNQLQADYDTFDNLKSGGSKEPEELIEQAKQFEREGEYRKAIERYLQLTPEIVDNTAVLAKCWTRAGELAAKFLMKDHADYVLRSLAPMLSNINRHAEAASFYAQCGQYKESVKSLIDGDLWDDAKRLAAELGPQMEEYVRKKQTEVLKASGQIEELEGVNASAALEMLAEQGQWDKCFEKAKQTRPDQLSKYMAKYITSVIRAKQAKEVLRVYGEYGTPCNREHFQLYRALGLLILLDKGKEDFETYSELRNIMLSVMNGLNASGADHRSAVYQQMDSLLWVANLYSNKIAFQSSSSLEALAAKSAISLLRYCGLVPVEKAFYDAGVLCRKVKWYNMAFVFLNHYLDIRDAIDEGTRTTGELDNSDLLNTDIPTDVELPDEPMISDDVHNEVKEWVLSASMDGDIQQVLRADDRNTFEGSLISSDGSEKHEPCVLTGYPVVGPKISFRTTNKYANKEDWNRFVAASRSEANEQLANIGEFIGTWCGSNPNYSM